MAFICLQEKNFHMINLYKDFLDHLIDENEVKKFIE